jgi:hypothetical protein
MERVTMIVTGHTVPTKGERANVYFNVETTERLETVFRYLQQIGDIPRNGTLNEWRAYVIGWCAQKAVEMITSQGE